ncbi:MAG: extracellular solute-binding protein [Spirochaetia bacterium]|jgi:raffinose/stachyose/melibiose transport system substrate-binding protein|nr:extracellular solute-binding protein [Spirochaetia bacterium]MCE1207948.1 extracellular solute-binding protein [Spirochaetia bacterium]HOI23427.1 extracellular solute-binding protein [Spirochaetales bacterium]
MRKAMCFAVLFSVIFSMGAFAQKTNLFVLNYIDATAPGYAEDQAIWQKFIDDNPDITIVKEELSNEPFHQKLAAYVAAGTVPDVMYMYPSGRSTILHEQKLVKDLAPLLGNDFLSNFMPSVVDPSGQKGKYLAELPQSVCYSTVMYTNTKLLADLGLKVPTTYQEMKAMLPKLKAKGIRPLLMANKDDWVMQSCLYSTIVGRMLGDEWIDKALAGKVKFTDKEFVKTLEFVEMMYKDGILGRDTIQISYGEAPALFAAGKAAFFIDGDWRQNAFITDKASGIALIDPKKQESDFGYFNFPAIPDEKNPGVVSAILGCGYGISSAIPAGSAKEKAAVKLLKYLYSQDVQRQYLELGKYITSRKDVKSDKLEPFTTKMSQYYASIGKTCYVLDGAMDTSIYTPLNLGLQQIGLGTKTPMQVAESIQAATDSWIASRK